jgi:hypothetical protein
VDESLRFRALSNAVHLEAEVKASAAGNAAVTAGPFKYSLRRPEVVSRGRGNAEAFWRLDGKKHVAEEEASLGIVLKVPRSRQHPVNAEGILRAYHDFEFWTADLFKDWNFTDAVRSFFRSGAPVANSCVWPNLLPTTT